jgi:hypothetical protein
MGELRHEAEVRRHASGRCLGDVVIEPGAGRLCDLLPGGCVRRGLRAVAQIGQAEIFDRIRNDSEVLITVGGKVDIGIHTERIDE